MTQKDQIRQWLEAGNDITPLQALKKFGCFRLASVVSKLKNEGMDIISNIVDDYNTGKRYAEYHIRFNRWGGMPDGWSKN